MTIAVMSDLHDNVTAWELLRAELDRRKIAVLINCGDTVAPSMVKHMSDTYHGTIHTVFGNNADRTLETQAVKNLFNVHHYGDRGAIDLEGRRIGFNHFPEVAEAMAATGEFDLVCHGHTHLKRWEKMNNCFVLNPGTAGGMFQYPSFATVKLADLSHEFIDLHL